MFRRAIELNPNYATAHHWYSSMLTGAGRLDEALAQAERAAELDPLSSVITNESWPRRWRVQGRFRGGGERLPKGDQAIDPSTPGGVSGPRSSECLCAQRFADAVPWL